MLSFNNVDAPSIENKAINIGIKNTTGDIISVLGSSDYYNTNFRFKFLNDIFKNINTDIIYGDVAYFSKFNQNKIIRKYKSDKFSKDKIAWGFMPAHQSMYIKKKIYDLAGNYDETYKIAGDYEFIGMFRREVMDAFMRNRASDLGATLINGLVTSIDTGDNNQGPYKLAYSDFTNGDKKRELKELNIDL